MPGRGRPYRADIAVPTRRALNVPTWLRPVAAACRESRASRGGKRVIGHLAPAVADWREKVRCAASRRGSGVEMPGMSGGLDNSRRAEMSLPWPLSAADAATAWRHCCAGVKNK